MKTLHSPKFFGATAALLLASGFWPTAQAADYASTVQALGPLAYWRLNETTPPPPALSAANSGSLGAAYTGYAVLDVAGGEPGQVGGAFRFVNNGWTVGLCGSKVDVPFGKDMNPSGSFSVEFWVKPTSTATDLFCPISALNGDGGVRQGWLFYMTANAQWMFRLGGPGNSYAGLVQGGTATGAAWHHIVGVYNAPTTEITLYVNGTKVAGPTKLGLPFVANTRRPLRMGGTGLTGNLGAYAGNRGWDGWLDEVAFYGAPLAADRIVAHYATGTTDPDGYASAVLADTPLGYWRLDEPAYTAPDPATLPVAANSGSLGATANGKYTPGAVNRVDGPSGAGFGADNKAVQFNGAVGNVAIPNDPGLNFLGNATMMAWVNPRINDNLRDILAHGYTTSPANGEILLRINGGNYQGGSWDGTDYVVSSAMPAGDIGNWVFLATTYDGANWKLYRNGELAATQAAGFGFLQVEADWAIGSVAQPTLPPANGRFFGGSVDEVAIFDKALSASDIRSVFQAALAPPVITLQPVPPAGTVYAGDTVTFTVAAEGVAPLTYQWTKNGQPMPGKTSTTLTLAGVQTTDNGAYAAVVSNPNGQTTSTVINLTVLATPPSIVTQPASATRYVGADITLKVVAGGSAPLSYQWSKGASPIGGATSATLTLSNLKGSDAADYTCKVTNPQGDAVSNPATLTVLSVPAGYAAAILPDNPLAYWRLGEKSGTVAYDYWNGINGEYRNATLGLSGFSLVDSDTAVGFTAANTYVGGISGTDISFTGGSVTFSIEAWVKGPADQVSGAGIVAKGTGTSGGSGDEQFAIDVNGGKFRFYSRKASDNAAVECPAVSGPNGAWQHLVAVYDGTSSTMLLYVNGVQEGTATADASGPRSSTHPVSIGARRGGVDPSYDLYFNGSIDEVAIYDTALTYDQVNAHYTAQYGVGQKPIIQVQPQPVTNYVGLPAKLTVAAAGTPPLEYQWKKGAANIAGAIGDTLSFDTLASSDTANYTVIVSNAAGSATSQVARITVLANPTTAPALRGLVAHLKFDNDLIDATGRGNNGTAVGDSVAIDGVPRFVDDGKLGKALHYVTDTNEPLRSAYVDLGLRPDLQFGATANFTVAFWIRLPVNFVGNDLPMIGNALNSANNHGYTFAPSYSTTVAGGWGWSLFGPGGASSGINVYGPVGSINDGGWHHLVFAYDRTGVGNTYLDGKLADSRLITIVGNLDTGRNTIVGQDPSGTYPESGSADIDDLGVFRRALTALEAASMFAAARNNLSYTGDNTPITITFQVSGGNVTLNWPAGVLRSADVVTGPYADVPGALPPYTVNPTDAKKYYQVRLP